MKYLGVDFGDARTGLALSDATGFLASSIGTIEEKNIGVTARKVAERANQEKVGAIVLGLPKNMNGTLGPRAEKTMQFAELLKKHFTGEIIFRDERCTTISAARALNVTDTRGKKRKAAIDTLSAAIILQDYLDSIRSRG